MRTGKKLDEVGTVHAQDGVQRKIRRAFDQAGASTARIGGKHPFPHVPGARMRQSGGRD